MNLKNFKIKNTKSTRRELDKIEGILCKMLARYNDPEALEYLHDLGYVDYSYKPNDKNGTAMFRNEKYTHIRSGLALAHLLFGCYHIDYSNLIIKIETIDGAKIETIYGDKVSEQIGENELIFEILE